MSIFNESNINNINDEIIKKGNYGSDENTKLETSFKLLYNGNSYPQEFTDNFNYILSSTVSSSHDATDVMRTDNDLKQKYMTIRSIEDFPVVKTYKKLENYGWNVMDGIPYGLLDAVVIKVCQKNLSMNREVMMLDNDFIIADKSKNLTNMYYLYKKENGKHYKYSKGTWIDYDWTKQGKATYVAHLDYKTIIPKLGCKTLQCNFSKKFFVASYDNYIDTISFDKIIQNNQIISGDYDKNDGICIYHKYCYLFSTFGDSAYIICNDNDNLCITNDGRGTFIKKDKTEIENNSETGFVTVLDPENLIIQTAYLSNTNVAENYLSWNFDENFLVVILKNTKTNKTYAYLMELQSKKFIDNFVKNRTNMEFYVDNFVEDDNKNFDELNKQKIKYVLNNYDVFTKKNRLLIYPKLFININALAFENQMNDKGSEGNNLWDEYTVDIRFQSNTAYLYGKETTRHFRNPDDIKQRINVYIKDNLYEHLGVSAGIDYDISHYNQYFTTDILINDSLITTKHTNYKIKFDDSVGMIFYKFNMYNYLTENESLILNDNGNINSTTGETQTYTNLDIFQNALNTKTDISFSKNVNVISSNNNYFLLKKYDDKIVLYINPFQSNFYYWMYEKYKDTDLSLIEIPIKNYCSNSYYDKTIDEIPDKTCLCLSPEKILDKHFNFKNSTAIQEQKTKLLNSAECISKTCQEYRENTKGSLKFINSLLNPCDEVELCELIVNSAGSITLENNKINQCLDRSQEDLDACKDVECDLGFACRYGKCVKRCSSGTECNEKENGFCVNGICSYREVPDPTPDTPDTPDTPPDTPKDKNTINIFGLKIKKSDFGILISCFIILIIIIIGMIILRRRK